MFIYYQSSTTGFFSCNYSLLSLKDHNYMNGFMYANQRVILVHIKRSNFNGLCLHHNFTCCAINFLDSISLRVLMQPLLFKFSIFALTFINYMSPLTWLRAFHNMILPGLISMHLVAPKPFGFVYRRVRWT